MTTRAPFSKSCGTPKRICRRTGDDILKAVMRYRHTHSIVVGFATVCLAALPAAAQEGGLGGPGPGRKPAPEAAEKAKPAPRLPDGKVDFGGKGVWAPIWVLDWADAKWAEKSQQVPFTPAGEKLFKERRATDSKDDPEGYCLPPGVPRY